MNLFFSYRFNHLYEKNIWSFKGCVGIWYHESSSHSFETKLIRWLWGFAQIFTTCVRTFPCDGFSGTDITFWASFKWPFFFFFDGAGTQEAAKRRKAENIDTVKRVGLSGNNLDFFIKWGQRNCKNLKIQAQVVQNFGKYCSSKKSDWSILSHWCHICFLKVNILCDLL